MFKTISKNMSAEIVEKKSKFIANIFYIESAEEAENYILEVKKKYHDARHNCYAYSIITEEGIKTKFSDDGEPSGTAGAPMLNILTANTITNVLVVVTRYFGGILLGTGGLVRAYSEATTKVIGESEIVKKDYGIECEIWTNYSDLEKLKYYFRQNNIKIIKTEFLEEIVITFDITKEKFDELEKNKNELNFNFKGLKVKKNKLIEFVE